MYIVNKYSRYGGECVSTYFFHKKENAEKRLRELLTTETKIWEREGLDPTWWPPCKTWENVVDYLMSQGGHPNVAWIDTIKFEDEVS